MSLRYRWIIIVLIIGWALYSMYPINEKIKLGLDLQGGMHVVLGVDTDKALEAKAENIVVQLRKELMSAGNNSVNYVQKDGFYKIRVGIADQEKRDSVIKKVKELFGYLEETGLDTDQNSVLFGFQPKYEKELRVATVDQSIEVVRNRIDQFGVSEPLIQKQGETHIIVQLPGVTDPERAINLIGQTAQLKFHLVDDKVSPKDIEDGKIPYDVIIVNEKVLEKGTGKVLSVVPYALKREAVLTGDYLVEAEVSFNNTKMLNEPVVKIRFDSAGAKLFESITGANVGKRLAIVLDDNVYSAPSLREKIAGGSAEISGNFTPETARDLAIVLRAGSLPAPVSILENRTVGPSLGADSINSGVKASLIGLLAVVLFMGIYYRLSGVVADIALGLNLVLLLGILGSFSSTLTLPGIAGVILTLGLAVDANVLIFERVREELRGGRTVANAIDIGYAKAFTTIVDSNITSLIAAIVLFQFGTGPIKGFAITLSVGIVASMFTAIFVTRTIFMTYLYNVKNVKNLSI